MIHLLKRHPFPVVARFDRVLALSYALPAAVLEPLLPPGLTLDTYGEHGFLTIALVQTRGLRPAGLPAGTSPGAADGAAEPGDPMLSTLGAVAAVDGVGWLGLPSELASGSDHDPRPVETA